MIDLIFKEGLAWLALPPFPLIPTFYIYRHASWGNFEGRSKVLSNNEINWHCLWEMSKSHLVFHSAYSNQQSWIWDPLQLKHVKAIQKKWGSSLSECTTKTQFERY